MTASPTAVLVGENLKARNDRQAAVNRERFRAAGVVALNLLSSPGSGKTALLERTLSEFGTRRRVGVIVGDLQTDNDARRLAGRGGPVVPITTGTVCHLEADMVARAAAGLDLAALDLLVIENVGNLVCPASFDLGEEARVVVLSTTEGEDKPLKYPRAFKTAQAVVVSKTDLAAAAGFDRDAALANIRAVAPQAAVFGLSARTGDGLDRWYNYLDGLIESRRRSADAG
jgi:hydrogenase nickel incorporation protein HypB